MATDTTTNESTDKRRAARIDIAPVRETSHVTIIQHPQPTDIQRRSQYRMGYTPDEAREIAERILDAADTAEHEDGIAFPDQYP